MEILPLLENDKEELCNIIDKIFSDLYQDKKFENKIFLYKSVIEMYNFGTNDIKMVLDNKIIGLYLFSNSNIEKDFIFKNYEIYYNKKGLEGLIMGVIPEYRNMGYGKALVEYSKTIKGYDYIWGGNYKKLNSSGFWLKYREFLGENEDNLYTIIDLKK